MDTSEGSRKWRNKSVKGGQGEGEITPEVPVLICFLWCDGNTLVLTSMVM